MPRISKSKKMRTSIIVSVPATTLADARHQQSANFKPSVCALLNDGYTVEVETTRDTKKFKTEREFLDWFEGLGESGATETRQ